MPIEITVTIISIVGGVFIAWFSYRGLHSYAIIRERRTNLKNSSIELINAFKHDLEELRILDAWHLGDTRNILLRTYGKHSKAAFEFISHLEGTERIKFREAWDKRGQVFILASKPVYFLHG